jgi:CHAT domain-containing protein
MLMENPENKKADLMNMSTRLYDILLASVLPELRASTNKLIIIPHGTLAYVPFEILPVSSISNKELDYKNYPYLLKDYSINYAFSAYSWAQDEKQRYPWKAEFAGFAPSYGSEFLASVRGLDSFTDYRGEIGNLKYTSEEIESAARHFRGTTFAGREATEHVFKNEAGKFRVLHLAMHAVADAVHPMESKLIFAVAADSIEDGFLNAYELYNMKLHADLAVLSACNTGFGVLRKGEGVMSLSRAFSYAGCKNLVMSLWKTDDKSTAEIMALFYSHLDKGLMIDEALRLAKLDYLASADPLRAHPYFWAAFVANGPMEAVQSSSTYRNILLWLLMASIAIAAWILLHRYRHQVTNQS